MYPVEWGWAGSMAQADEDVATAPIDLVIERIRRVYRGWSRSSSGML